MSLRDLIGEGKLLVAVAIVMLLIAVLIMIALALLSRIAPALLSDWRKRHRK